ncbi:MAG: hypothetical protein K2W92_02945 [Alphaproteobacteria bacterium]|nr:hypothetical protein [Burkholderiaceae bacterium]MBY0292230.1 hypothetical protein [Alphaproteobacteria bacterium]
MNEVFLDIAKSFQNSESVKRLHENNLDLDEKYLTDFIKSHKEKFPEVENLVFKTVLISCAVHLSQQEKDNKLNLYNVVYCIRSLKDIIPIYQTLSVAEYIKKVATQLGRLRKESDKTLHPFMKAIKEDLLS